MSMRRIAGIARPSQLAHPELAIIVRAAIAMVETKNEHRESTLATKFAPRQSGHDECVIMGMVSVVLRNDSEIVGAAPLLVAFLMLEDLYELLAILLQGL